MALTSSDKSQIETIARKEIKSFMDSTQAHNIVMRIIQKELGGRRIDERMVDLATKVVVELFKTFWQRKSFWEGAIKNVR
ncbi:MAG TPA: hypothetical protein PK698_02270 [Bacilli bacterium]|jgi:hypothetical protein|nr:hypothetical protein [Bacilli bacterium]